MFFYKTKVYMQDVRNDFKCMYRGHCANGIVCIQMHNSVANNYEMSSTKLNGTKRLTYSIKFLEIS